MNETIIVVNDRKFNIGCQPGEEAYVQTLANVLDQKVCPIMEKGSHLSEAHGLVLAGLMLCEEIKVQKDTIAQLQQEKSTNNPQSNDQKINEVVEEKLHEQELVMSQIITYLANEVEELAERLEKA